MKVFLSYRRDDSQHFTGRLAERLRRVRGIAHVFLDVDSITPGADFEQVVHESLVQCSAALIVIGPRWLEPSAGGIPRLFEDADFVRREIREALKSESRVIPVLVDGAPMPMPEQLPSDIRLLATRNAVSMRHAAFDRDLAPLIDSVLRRRPPGRLVQFLREHPILAALLDGLVGSVVAFFALVVGLAVFNAITHRSLDEKVGGPGMALILTALILIIGGVLPWHLRHRGILR
ncbi:MAG: toll/interleukin-1 receptor domain-containing protein [Rhizomicrobium sp.]